MKDLDLMAYDYVADLNQEQRRAVKHGAKDGSALDAGPLLVIAGAGSGKTPNSLRRRITLRSLRLRNEAFNNIRYRIVTGPLRGDSTTIAYSPYTDRTNGQRGKYSVTKTNGEIYRLLNELAVACGCPGESGTETFFYVLDAAVVKVVGQWSIVDDSHREGLGFNVNALLADAIAEALSDQQRGDDSVN